jgi:hypothetical protein
MQSAHEAAGAAGTRRSPRPLRGRKINANLGRIASRGMKLCLELFLLFENFEVDVCEAILNLAQQNAPVMPGLDPGIHQSS